MTRILTPICTALFLSLAFSGCKNADERAAEIIAARDQAQAQAKLEAEIAKLRAEADANARKDADSRNRADADAQNARTMKDNEARDLALAQAQAELAKATADARRVQAEAEAKMKSLADAEEAAKRQRADAETNRKLAELKDAAAKADSAARSARASAALAAELIRQSKLNPSGGMAPGTPSGSAVIGSKGGSVVAADGTGSSVTVPPGSLNSNTPVTIATVPPPPGGNCAVVCTPAGKVWSPPVVVRFRLKPGVPAKVPGTYLRVDFWNPATQAYLPPAPAVFAMVDSDPRFATALVPHFSTIVVRQEGGRARPELSAAEVAEIEASDGGLDEEGHPLYLYDGGSGDGEEHGDPPTDTRVLIVPPPAPGEDEAGEDSDTRDEEGAGEPGFPPHSPGEGEDEPSIPEEEDLIPR